MHKHVQYVFNRPICLQLIQIRLHSQVVNVLLFLQEL